VGKLGLALRDFTIVAGLGLGRRCEQLVFLQDALGEVIRAHVQNCGGQRSAVWAWGGPGK
jgi:hypothetical protein